jgi:hypothetical protein
MSPLRKGSIACAIALALSCSSGTPDPIADSTPPTVSGTTPPNGASGVAVGSPLAVVFSETMEGSSVAFSATPPVACATSWNAESTVATCTPAAPLAHGTTYAVGVSGNDQAGNALAPYAFSFTTEGVPDLEPPAVVETSPAHGATVGTSARIAITFSEPMDRTTVVAAATAGASAYDLGPPGWSSGDTKLTFASPPAPLAHGAQVVATVVGSDLAGNAMADAAAFEFSVEPQPAVASVSPAKDATGVSLTTNVAVTFNVAASRDSVEAALSVLAGTTPLTCLFSWTADSKAVSCDPLEDLAFSTTYTVSLGAGARSALGDPVVANGLVPSSFTTAADDPPPTVVERDASADVGAGNVTTTAPITIVFSEAMNRLSAQSAFALECAAPQAGTFTWDATETRMTFTPAPPLPHGATCTWRVIAGAEDKGGKALLADAGGAFKVVKEASRELLATAQSGTVFSTASSASIDRDGPETYVGDSSANQQARTYYTFDLAALSPAPLAILDAQLRATATGWNGGPPAGIGTLYAQSVQYGPTLDVGDATVETDHFLSYVCPIAVLPSPTLLLAERAQETAVVAPIAPRKCYYQTAVPLPSNTYRWPAAGDALVAEVGGHVARQWAQRQDRGSLAQLRLAFSGAPDGDGSTELGRLHGPSSTATTMRPKLTVHYEHAW